MSADNGVYIAEFRDGFRVAYASSIENIDSYPVGSEERKKQLKNYFGNSAVFPSKDSAILEAHRIADEISNDGPLEYGVCSVGFYEHWDDIAERCLSCGGSGVVHKRMGVK